MAESLREEVARALHKTHESKCTRMFSWNMAHVDWEDLNRSAKQLYRSAAQKILSLLIEKVEGIEEPKWPSQRKGFNRTIQAVITVLKGGEW